MNDDNNNNPFLKEEEKKKISLFGKKQEEEQVVTTLTLKDVQNMTFPTEEQQQQTVVAQKPAEPTLEQIHERRGKIIKGARRVRNFVEIAIVIIVVVSLFTGYRAYSAKVNQKLIFKEHSTIYELNRVKDSLSVVQKEEFCVQNECEEKEIKQYDIYYGSFKKNMIRVYFDLTFKWQSGRKNINHKDIRTKLGARSVFSMIHHDPDFLSLKPFKGYEVLGFEQKSEYTVRGFQYEEKEGHFYVTIALGHKEALGYNLEVYEVHCDENNNYKIYILESEPDLSEEKWINACAPKLDMELDTKPNSIQVINLLDGEQFDDYKDVFADFQALLDS